MARFWHKPGVLMTAYVALYVAAGARSHGAPFPATVSQFLSPPDLGPVLIGAFLAWRVTRGGWLSRVLIVVFTVGLMQKVLWGSGMTSGGLFGLSVLAVYLVQIALLVSTPVYERTRKDMADHPPSSARLWPTPPWWMGAVAVTAGLIITLLFLGSEELRAVPCSPAPRSASPAQCAAVAQGFPVHFLSAVPEGNVSSPVISKGAAAEDLAIWTVLSLVACYLIWLPSRRPADAAATAVAATI
jgi:hypothetical protein